MKKIYIGTFLALIAIYIVLSFALPVDPAIMQRYNISELRSRLLNLTVVIPISLIYLSALYGFIRVRSYAIKIRKTKEGPAFNLIALGLTVMAFGLPTRSIISSLTSYVKHAHPEILAEMTLARQYIGIIVTLTAVILLARGAYMLYDTLERRTSGKYSFYGLLAPISLAVIYTWLITTQANNDPGGAPYFVPVWMVIITIAIPYVFTWCVGLWAAIRLYRYQFVVKGVIYKRALNYLAKGIAVVVLVAVLVQFLTTLSGVINRLDLGPLLIALYVLVAFYAVGFGLVARGANKLKQIEEA